MYIGRLDTIIKALDRPPDTPEQVYQLAVGEFSSEQKLAEYNKKKRSKIKKWHFEYFRENELLPLREEDETEDKNIKKIQAFPEKIGTRRIFHYHGNHLQGMKCQEFSCFCPPCLADPTKMGVVPGCWSNEPADYLPMKRLSKRNYDQV